MGRITISIADELEARLDAYAEEHGLPVSQVAARALEAYLSAPPPPPPTPVGEDQVARAYVEQLARHVGELRDFVEQAAGWVSGPLNPLKDQVPEPLPAPDWGAEAPSD